MVTSTNLPDKKVVKMAERNQSNIVVPQRTLLGEVNEHITCPLCRGYYIDATTIVECLHSFCRSCIIKHLQVKSYCPVCEMMINSAKPNIKPDKALQDIVYKLVPGLFQREMERRQHFYASRPGTAAAATPEQRGEDTERIIFSPEDVISFSLEYADATDTDSISSKSSDSNELPAASTTSRRYLQCPAVVNISHLKKFVSMKYDVDCSQFSIDILYKRVPLPDYYTLMDIAYIYNWKRNEPMRFFFQITDFIAIRTRYGLFDRNHKLSNLRDIKASPSHTDDTNVNSPASNSLDQVFEKPFDMDSPNPDFDSSKSEKQQADLTESYNAKTTNPVKNIEEEEKSQFLNSFELKAKSNQCLKPMSINSVKEDALALSSKNIQNSPTSNCKAEENCLKRKITTETSDVKKPKLESESYINPNSTKNFTSTLKLETQSVKSIAGSSTTTPSKLEASQTNKPQHAIFHKRPVPNAHSITPPKRKMSDIPSQTPSPLDPQIKTTTTLKVPSTSKSDIARKEKTEESPKQIHKKMPELKPSVPTAVQMSQNKIPTVGKVRMDLLANNSDPTIDRSKILSQVKTSLSVSNPSHVTAGDPLKSLFDSCKINIPSSLSITLTDQKTEQQSTTEGSECKNLLNKTLQPGNASALHKVPSPPVHNYIEVIKLLDTDSKTPPTKSEPNPSKPVSNLKLQNKSSDVSAKGPIPSLKPISDAKIPKVGGAGPITFQQSFEQQLQSEKTKLPKPKTQVPKLMPATPKVLNAVNKLNMSKALTGNQDQKQSISKPDNVLDLSTAHNATAQIEIQQSKNLETCSAPNITKKSSPISSVMPSSIFSPGRVQSSNIAELRTLPNTKANPSKVDSTYLPSTAKQEVNLNPNNVKCQSITSGAPSPNHITTPPLPRTHTRSPSTSPKLVIAEEKHISNTEVNASQSNQNVNLPTPNPVVNKADSLNSPNPILQTSKPSKTSTQGKSPSSSQSATSSKPSSSVGSPTDFLTPPQLISAQHALLRHMEMQNAWLVKAQRQYDLFKNMSNISQKSQNKDKQ